MKAWLCRWLGIVDYSGAIANLEQGLRNAHEATIALKAEHEKADAELIYELNELRNKIPVEVTQDVKHPVRVLRNFREFRTTIEHKPLRSERTS